MGPSASASTRIAVATSNERPIDGPSWIFLISKMVQPHELREASPRQSP